MAEEVSTPSAGSETPVSEQPAKTFTEEEFNNQLENAKKQWENDFREKLKSENDEAKKLSKMSEEEKLEYRQKQFDEEKAQYEKEKLEFEAGKILADKKLPASCAKYLCGSDAESTKANIAEFEKAFASAVETAVADRLKGTPPKLGANGPTLSMETIKKMSVEEINRNWDEIKKFK